MTVHPKALQDFQSPPSQSGIPQIESVNQKHAFLCGDSPLLTFTTPLLQTIKPLDPWEKNHPGYVWAGYGFPILFVTYVVFLGLHIRPLGLCMGLAQLLNELRVKHTVFPNY